MLAKNRATFDAVERAYGVDRYTSSPRSGASNRTTAPWSATGRCCARPRRSPASAAGRIISATSFSPSLEMLHRGDVTAGAGEGLVGRRVRADAVHADGLQALRGRFRRRRPPRRGRLDAGSDRLDRQQPQARTAGRPGRPGATRSCVPKSFNFLLADRSQAEDDRGMGAARHRARRRQGVSARRTTAPILLVPAGAQGPGFLMLQQFPRHHEIQPVRGLCARDRASLRPAARRRRRSCRPGRGTSAC